MAGGDSDTAFKLFCISSSLLYCKRHSYGQFGLLLWQHRHDLVSGSTHLWYRLLSGELQIRYLGNIRSSLMADRAVFIYVGFTHVHCLKKMQPVLVKLQNNVITLSMVTWPVTSYVISTSWWRHGNFLACSFCSLAPYFYLLIIHLWRLNRTAVKEFTIHWSFRWQPSWLISPFPWCNFSDLLFWGCVHPT